MDKRKKAFTPGVGLRNRPTISGIEMQEIKKIKKNINDEECILQAQKNTS